MRKAFALIYESAVVKVASVIKMEVINEPESTSDCADLEQTLWQHVTSGEGDEREREGRKKMAPHFLERNIDTREVLTADQLDTD